MAVLASDSGGSLGLRLRLAVRDWTTNLDCSRGLRLGCEVWITGPDGPWGSLDHRVAWAATGLHRTAAAARGAVRPVRSG